jgi:hypothetical protein
METESQTAGLAGGSRSKRGLHAGHQPPEEAPGQPRVVGKDDPFSLGNHGRYIATHAGRDNEDGA